MLILGYLVCMKMMNEMWSIGCDGVYLGIEVEMMCEMKVVNSWVDFRYGVKEIKGGFEFEIGSIEFKDIYLLISYVSSVIFCWVFLF